MLDTALVCFRNDFRLLDNPALAEAVRLKFAVLPVFIYDTDSTGEWPLGGASKWWLHQSILDVQRQIKELGGQFILRQGSTASVFRELVEASGARAVFWNRRYLLSERTIDSVAMEMLKDMGIEVHSFQASLLVEPWTTANKEGNPFKVYSPFWRSIKDRPLVPPVELDLKQIAFAQLEIDSLVIDELELLPKNEEWHEGFHKHWEVSEAKARTRLDEFINTSVDAYAVDRDRPDLTGTSSLSPYLRWGQISPMQIAQALSERCELSDKGPMVYLKEIYWREFAYYVIYHFPHTSEDPLQEKYAKFPWESDKEMFADWKWGRTGYPIVDAGMRQLYATGWMHNRVRMIVASLLVKHLLHSWRAGAEWFWDTLVDADLANNSLGWQWSGGCGADAAPYFRIFNPMIQGMKFDPNGTYVKHWVPELKDLPPEFIHQPWEADTETLASFGVVLGEHYPKPIIDHSMGRERALEALASIKE